MKNTIKSHEDAIFYLLGLNDPLAFHKEEDASEASINWAIRLLRFMHEGNVPVTDICAHNLGISIFFCLNKKQFWAKIKPDGETVIYQKRDGEYKKWNVIGG